jgi:hypothetical protein
MWRVWNAIAYLRSRSFHDDHGIFNQSGKKKLTPLDITKYRVMKYYSVAPKDMEDLSLEELIKMNKALDIFIAQDILNQFKVSSFPYMKKDQKESLHKEFHKIANPNIWDKPKVLSLKDIAQMLGGANGSR